MSSALVERTGHELIAEVFKRDNEGRPRVRTAFLYGPPGTGKTSAAVAYAKTISDHVLKVTMNDGDMAAKHEGFFVPAGDHFEWLDGMIVQAWTYNDGRGCPIVIDEVDHASPEVMSLLLAALDDEKVAQLSLPNRKTVRPGPDFIAIGTSNQTPAALIPALADRFEAKINVAAASKEMIESLHPEIRKVADTIRLAASRDGRGEVTFRDLKHYTDFRNKGYDQVLAAQLAFGHRFADVVTAIRAAA